MTTDNSKIFQILVVDDNPKNIQVLGTILREAGYLVGFAMDGHQAMDVLKDNSEYDLVLMDVDMPVMDGFETCKAIRKFEHFSNMPIIFLTAHSETDNVIRGFATGAQDYVAKPFNSYELLARVHTHLQLKHRTEQISEMNNVLEERVAERTRNLKEANEKLFLLDKAKSDVLALIAHEMRTPLNSIVGVAEMLNKEISGTEYGEFIELLLRSAKRLNQFAEISLLITKLKLERVHFSPEEHNLQRLIDIALVDVYDEMSSKRLTIKKEYSDEEVNIVLDEVLINKAIRFVLENAVKYSPLEGVVTLGITSDADYVKLSIRDEGPGFSEESMAQMFELFNASDISHHSEGLGLSLATAKLIVDIHHGKIEAMNMAPGACVVFCLPVTRN